jgi:predicted HTH transcriptional regulator
MDMSLWRVDRFSEFLEARRQLIARKMNEFLSSLIAEPEEIHHRPIVELVRLGESRVLEFKSTLQWDLVRNERNEALRHSVLKTVAAFMNSDGGTLVIGVEDDRKVLGIGKDLQLLGGSTDKFEQLVVSLLSEYLGASQAHYYKIRFECLEDKEVCVIDVDSVRDSFFMKTGKGKEFFVRVGNTTRSLDPEQTLQYIEARSSQ